MPMIVSLVLTIPEDQSMIVHVLKDISIPVLLNVPLVTVNVSLVVVPPIIVPLVKVPEFLDLNQFVVVKIMNSLMILVYVKLVVSDVLLVLMNILVSLVLTKPEDQSMNVHVLKDIMKSMPNKNVNNVLHNVLNVKPMLTTVSFVLLTESNLHQLVHVHPEKLILVVYVLFVTGDVLNVMVLLPIVILVLITESLPQLVSVQMELMKLTVKVSVQIVMTNVVNVSLPLITV